MKKNLILLGLIFSINKANAQKLKQADVPAEVKKTFAAHYPNVKEAKWEKEGANYEAGFNLNAVETSILINAKGSLIETETEIKPTELPKLVMDYVNQNFPDQKIKEASKIVDVKGNTTFEAEIKGKDYIFDSKGNLVKKP